MARHPSTAPLSLSVLTEPFPPWVFPEFVSWNTTEYRCQGCLYANVRQLVDSRGRQHLASSCSSDRRPLHFYFLAQDSQHIVSEESRIQGQTRLCCATAHETRRPVITMYTQYCAQCGRVVWCGVVCVVSGQGEQVFLLQTRQTSAFQHAPPAPRTKRDGQATG